MQLKCTKPMSTCISGKKKKKKNLTFLKHSMNRLLSSYDKGGLLSQFPWPIKGHNPPV